MAFYDWNKDGKKDFTDDFIEYSIYRHCTDKMNENKSESNQSSGSGTGCLTMIVAVIVIWIVGSILGM